MIGCDLVDIKRILSAYQRFGNNFLKRILSEKEIAVFHERKCSIEYLSGRFAAKESIVKSLGTGIGRISFQDIEILNNNLGAPLVYIKGVLRVDISISISHVKEYAMAVSYIDRSLL